MVDLQTLANAIAGLDEETAVSVITTVLTARPELAPSVVNFAVPDLTYPPSKALIERRAQGTLKAYSQEKSFGYIDCPELQEVFGHDVMVHGKQLNGLGVMPGTPVNFAVVLNKDNNPQAFDVTPEDGKGKGKGAGGMGSGMGMPLPAFSDIMGGCGGMGMGAGSMGMGMGMGMDMSMNMGMGGFGMPGGGSGPYSKGAWPGKDGGKIGGGKGGKNDMKEALGQFMGVIKSFNEQNGYGFIECEELRRQGHTKDVFLHHNQAAGFTVGAQVRFMAYLNAKGQPQAKDLAMIDGSIPQEQLALNPTRGATSPAALS